MFALKLKAFMTHLLLSSFFVGMLLLFIYLYWYPDNFSYISGLSAIVFMMLVIDLILGPLLTFILYNPQKRGMKFDFLIIAFFQLAALSYASYTIYEAHPLYAVYSVDRFTLVAANEVSPNEAKIAAFRKSKLTGYLMVYAKPPEDPKIAEKIMFDVLSGEPDIDKRPELYEPFKDHLNDVISHSLSIDNILARQDIKNELKKFEGKHGNYKKFALLPLSGQSKDVIWALDKKTGKPIDIININPWAMSVNL